MSEIAEKLIARELEYDGMPVVRLTISAPELKDDGAAAKRINAFYRHAGRAVEKHLRKKLLPLAGHDFDAAVAKSRPFEPYRVKITFEASQPESKTEPLVVRRRIYARLGGTERERMLTERWNMRLGLPEKLYSEPADYSLLVE